MIRILKIVGYYDSVVTKEEKSRDNNKKWVLIMLIKMMNDKFF